MLLIVEGYVYLALIMAIFVAVAGFLVWGVLAREPFVALAAILVGIPVVATTVRALRALWFAWPPPQGIEVTPTFGGPLYDAVQQIAQRVGAPRVHRILVTRTNNASAARIARIGVFWHANTLLLGYPMLATLSVDQMRAVIAHELGHLTHAHGRVSTWVCRTQLSWTRLMNVLERHQSVPAHVYFLFRFYVPRLRAHAAAVSRQQELIADRLAADIAGPERAAEALVATAIGEYVFDEVFWPEIDERVQDDPAPPTPFSEMSPDIWTAQGDTELFDRLLAATRPSDSASHPSLRERLAAIGQPPRWPGPVTVTGADAFFGSQKRELAAALDREWQATHGNGWTQRHLAIRQRRDRLAVLAALPSPTREQAFERARLTLEEGDEDGALELYLLAHRQGDAAAGVAAGRMLLAREDEAGVALIETAIVTDTALIEEGCGEIVAFLEGRGRYADAYRYRQQITRARARRPLNPPDSMETPPVRP
jgi:Zn-dependent protease with chaperone function